MKIAIIGYSGCGKSTLAKYLATRYSIPLLYLDKVQFTANWQERDRSQAVGIVSEFMEQTSWVIDGNYNAFLQEERLSQADCIIFMNFPRFTCLWRAFKRYFTYRHKSRESAADGCIEKIDMEFVWWILYEGRTKQKRDHYKEICSRYSQKTIILKSQKDIDTFIANPPADTLQ